ncbi:MAG TPA: ABC transporter ATP-binding protein [Firmicutes bacterium]|nr:ABC transporter ATP-binding protein [Bacillota bacterium]
MTHLLELDNITKAFAGKTVVDGLSCQVRAGEVLGMLGHNGAGKTTTIRCVLGIIRPDSGRVLFHFNGGPSPLLPALVGYLPEERGLYKKQKVLDILLYLAKLKNYPVARARQRVRQYLQKFDLTDWEKGKTEELSKGMAQKIQFIAAVLHEPKLVILDEPFSGLDPVSQEQLKAEIRTLAAQGAAVVLSSHQMHLVEEVCDHILLLDRGQTVLSGDLRQIKEQFADYKCEIVGDNRHLDFSSIPEIRQVKQEEGRTLIYLQKGADPVKTMQALPAGTTIRELTLNRVSLHEIYLSMAGGGMDNEK